MSHRRSARSNVRIYNPRMRRRSNWSLLSKPELRLLMAGLAGWEERSIGSVRTRIRRKRREAVAFYRAKYGGLADDRLWVGPKMNRKGLRWNRLGLHDPRRENEPGVLWDET
jgi:hypothetical protein